MNLALWIMLPLLGASVMAALFCCRERNIAIIHLQKMQRETDYWKQECIKAQNQVMEIGQNMEMWQEAPMPALMNNAYNAIELPLQ